MYNYNNYKLPEALEAIWSSGDRPKEGLAGNSGTTGQPDRSLLLIIISIKIRNYYYYYYQMRPLDTPDRLDT